MSRPRQRINLLALGAISLILLANRAAAADRPPKRLPAFPGAEGFGAHTPGGRGGRIIEVTNLKSRGPGSLNAACQAKGPRIVVFRVSGVINGGVYIPEPFITVAGQTAPGDGICLRNGVLYAAGHDVVIRHLRSRPGDHPFGPDASERDCIAVHGHNMVIDHCSASWGIDENISAGADMRDVTFQWCITSESLMDSLHPKGRHGMGMILGGIRQRVSVHHCLFAHNNGRNPYINAKRSKTTNIIDFRNNVIYNRVVMACSTGGGNLRFNYVGNFLKMAPKGIKVIPRAVWIFPYGHDPKVYARDNVWPGSPKAGRGKPRPQRDHWDIVWDFVDRSLKRAPESMRLQQPAPAPTVTTETPRQAYRSVMCFAGCTRPVRDVVDARIVAEVRSGRGHLIDSQWDVGGWPTYASSAPPADSDHDAMPDAWEKRYGFNPKDASDGPKDRDGDGYTNVEEYLNETDPAKPDTGAPVPQTVVQIQAGNVAIRSKAARKIGKERFAKAQIPKATKESREALLKKVRESGREVAEVLGIEFVRIPPVGAGKPARGSAAGKGKPKFTTPYELSVCEITQAQWETVMGTRPWSGQIGAEDNPKHPATYVSRLDCREFIRRLNACLPVRHLQTGTQTGGGRQYRLPTQAEWRYAAQAGTDSRFGFGADKDRLIEYAWCSIRHSKLGKKMRNLPTAVGRLKPNAWGLHDMAGNAHEWVSDSRKYRNYHSRCHPTTGFEYREVGHLCGGHFRWRAWQVLRYPYSTHWPHYRGVGVGFRLLRALADK